MFKIGWIVLFLLMALGTQAQDTLPKISVTQLGRKALVSWVNTYPNVTNINIQRSYDSTGRFRTIGSVLNVHSPTNGFVDTKEFLPNEQYYRLFVTFEGGTYLFTEAKRPVPDTNQISVPVETQPQETVQTWFTPSRRVYTGKDNNVIISLPAAATKKYSVKFYEDSGEFLFAIPRVPEAYVTLDKVNFGHSGLFRFEIYEDEKLIESHKFYIPQDGRRMPVLDVNGYLR